MLRELRRLVMAIAIPTALASAQAQAQTEGVFIHHSFETGNGYRGMPDMMRRAYVMGVFDGMLFSPMIATSDLPRARSLGQCEERMNMTDQQLTAIVDRYLDSNPVLWGDDMHGVVYSALSEACGHYGIRLLGKPSK
ncbi:hypothetical protein [Trinickia sp. Y13]|uniref:hypothetical protein n=1 Tax=Trinickia sp. Y13 TaxID=2917807 RepID=UPI0024075A1C|nr:hypothetical protein [Trinickia sp. Y13]MDG0024954.1 hypothetical protein [Trinickia sp. Y13]